MERIQKELKVTEDMMAGPRTEYDFAVILGGNPTRDETGLSPLYRVVDAIVQLIHSTGPMNVFCFGSMLVHSGHGLQGLCPLVVNPIY